MNTSYGNRWVLIPQLKNSSSFKTHEHVFFARSLPFISNWIEMVSKTFILYTLQETNISPQNGILKMIFLFPRWDMLIPWRVFLYLHWSQTPTKNSQQFVIQQASCPANTTCRRLQASNNVISTAVKETPRQLSLRWRIVKDLLFWVGDS